MTINKKIWVGDELISQAALNQTSAEDAVNVTDNIHEQFLLGLNLGSASENVDPNEPDNGLAVFVDSIIQAVFALEEIFRISTGATGILDRRLIQFLYIATGTKSFLPRRQ